MKGMFLIFSGILLSFTGIYMMLISMHNYWYDTSIRMAYHQSMEYVMKLDSEDALYSQNGFNERLRQMMPKDVTFETKLLGINYYPKIFKMNLYAKKPIYKPFKITTTMVEDPEL